MAFSRRRFLTFAGASAAVTLLSPLEAFYARVAQGQSTAGVGYGPLRPRLPRNSFQLSPQWRVPFLELPEGFSYTALSITGETMSDGNPVPGDHDGMAAFAGSRGETILVRNHELSLNETNKFGIVAPNDKKYDPAAIAGTTTLIISPSGKVTKQFGSLSGTIRNCAGGLTPWRTWVSCEEDVSTPNSNPNITKKHGYNFEVPVSENIELANPIPLIAMGRFNHEAIAVDPKTGYVYQTEDRGDSCFYRFRPDQYGKLQSGVLEALVITGEPTLNTATGFMSRFGRKPVPVEWVQIEDVDPNEDTLRKEAQAKGAATFVRGEGIWYGNGLIYFTATSGGDAEAGQVFAYNPKDNTLSLVVESPGQEVLDSPDNITVSPFGDLFICEDGDAEQFVVGVNRQGEMYQFARNGINTSEFAGACFSPDGRFLFVNIQNPGVTLAIQGPWSRS